jgi:YVTN family beta-propeller protein
MGRCEVETMSEWDTTTGFPRGRRAVVLGLVVFVAGALVAVGALKAAHKIHSPAPPSVSFPSAGYGLDGPTSAALVSGDLYVANGTGDSVTVVDAGTGSHVATIAGPAFGFARPSAIVAVGPDLVVANAATGSLTEFAASTRTLVRTVPGIADPVALVATSGDLYVLSGTGAVTKVALATGAVVGTATGSPFGFATPTAIAAAGDHLYVTNSSADSVTEIDGATMSHLATLQGPEYHFATPMGVAVRGADVWVTNEAADSVTEFSAVTGRLVRVVVDHTNLPTPGPIIATDEYVFAVSPPGDSPMVSQIIPGHRTVAWMICNTNGPYLFNNPQAAVVSGANLWVVNEGGSSLTDMNTDSGALIRTIS